MAVTVLDAHVHFYPEFDLRLFLLSARENAIRLAGSPLAETLLCLTESASCRWFERLTRAVDRHCEDITVDATAEPCALRICSPEQHSPIVVIAGHQVITAEDLEVLVIGLIDKPADGQPAANVIREALAKQAIVVLPWGFGKWWLARGRAVRALIDQFGEALCLGDNGGRLQWSRQPELLKLGESRGLAMLPGSDPLPFAGQERRVCSYGLVISDPVDTVSPLHWLRARLPQLRARQAGRRERLDRFCKHQLLMQMRKRL